MSNHKIIFTGPVGAGKTTAISSISDVPLISTEECASDMTREHKASTTVAMDYGLMNLHEGERIHLYGTPGQERFDFMWEILTEGGIGLVLLIDNSRPEPFHDLRFFLKAFNYFIEHTKIAVGVTRMDSHATPTINDYHRQLYDYPIRPPIFTVDAREKRDVSLLIESLLFSIDPGIA